MFYILETCDRHPASRFIDEMFLSLLEDEWIRPYYPKYLNEISVHIFLFIICFEKLTTANISVKRPDSDFDILITETENGRNQ